MRAACTGRRVRSTPSGLAEWRAVPVRPLSRLDPDAYTRASAPRAEPSRSRRAHYTEEETTTSGRQDSSEAHGQDPCTVLPRRRHGLAHQARWPGHRGDRQVPPHRGAVAHRDRHGARPLLARARARSRPRPSRPCSRSSTVASSRPRSRRPRRRTSTRLLSPPPGKADAGTRPDAAQEGREEGRAQGRRGQGRRQGRRAKADDKATEAPTEAAADDTAKAEA